MASKAYTFGNSAHVELGDADLYYSGGTVPDLIAVETPAGGFRTENCSHSRARELNYMLGDNRKDCWRDWAVVSENKLERIAQTGVPPAKQTP